MGRFGNALPFHADLVDSARFGGIAVGEHEGRDVLHHLGASADHGHAPDTAELMNGDQPTYDGIIFHRHMTCERAHIGHDDVIAQGRIMRQMTIGEDMVF